MLFNRTTALRARIIKRQPPDRSPLPAPDADALHHNRRVRERIEREIADRGAWISFARYMELALYAPGLGYYSAGAAKFGASGDFITAPELSALFAHTLARQFAPLLALIGDHAGDFAGGDILELGAGSGRLALDLLTELERIGQLPRRYVILEIGADLAARQRALLAEHAPHLVDRVEWIQRLPESFTGTIVANEVIDALPTHLVVWREAGIYEQGVAVEAGQFVWRDQTIARGPLLTAASRLQPGLGDLRDYAGGYRSEINLAAAKLVASLASLLVKGAIFLIDYGFGESEYYHAQRDRGTLMCHYRHRAHEDPFHLPGLEDITSHVDFSAIAASGIGAGLRLDGYTTQAQFLINCGITELLGEVAASDPGYASIARVAQKLLSPTEMGELFKVMALTKNLPEPMPGFSQGDKRRLL